MPVCQCTTLSEVVVRQPPAYPIITAHLLLLVVVDVVGGGLVLLAVAPQRGPPRLELPLLHWLGQVEHHVVVRTDELGDGEGRGGLRGGGGGGGSNRLRAAQTIRRKRWRSVRPPNPIRHLRTLLLLVVAVAYLCLPPVRHVEVVPLLVLAAEQLGGHGTLTHMPDRRTRLVLVHAVGAAEPFVVAEAAAVEVLGLDTIDLPGLVTEQEPLEDTS